MGNFGDYDVALEVRDIIEKMVSMEIERSRPRYQMAIVVSIDRPNRKCEVQFPGDTTTAVVNMGSIQPASAGQIVRIAGLAQDRYVDDVIGQPWIEGLVEDLGTEVADKIKTHYAASTSPPTATANGDLWVVTDLGALYRWNGSAWVDTGLASTIQARSKGVDLITNGTGSMQNNTNFPLLTFDGLDYPAGVSGSFITPSTAGVSMVTTDRVPFNPNIKYRFSFQCRQTVAAATGRMYGFIAPLDRMGNLINPHHYMYINGTMTTLAAPLAPGHTTITLTSSANWYGSAGKPAGAASYQRNIQFWNYTDPLGKVWPAGSYTRNTGSTSGSWADGGISGNVITLSTPWAGGSYAAGTPVSNATSGNNYPYMTTATNVLVPETWTLYGETFDKGIMSSALQAVTTTGGAGWTTGMPPGTAQLSPGWLLNQGAGGGRHSIAGISMSEAGAANQANVDQATIISDIQDDLVGVNGLIDAKAVIWVQATAPTGLTAAETGDIWINTSTADRISYYWDGDSWENITNPDAIAALAAVQGKITTFYQDGPPIAESVGDLWIDTNDSNKLYRWNATALGVMARTNLMTNPSIETNTTGYTTSSVTTVREQVGANFQPQGTWSLRTVPTGASNDCYVSIAPSGGWGPYVGQQVTVSAWVYTGTAQGGVVNSRARKIVTFSRVAAEAYTELASAAGTNGPVVGGQRIHVTFTVLGTDTLVRLYNGSATTDGKWVHWDGVMIEQTDELRPYFDGSTAGAAWSGTAHGSTSTYTPTWVEVADARIANIASTLTTVQTDITGLSGKIDGKAAVYVQGTQPHDSNLATDQGDIWVDTANGRIIKTYNGSDWVVSDDTRLATALSTAQGKITTYYASTAPTGGGLANGDLWVRTNTNLIYRYDLPSTTWIPLPVTAGSMSPELNFMAGQKLYDTCSDATAWTKTGTGTYSIVQTSAAETGGYVMQVAGAAQMIRNGENAQIVPFDPGILYRVTFRVRQTVNPGSGGSLVYLGLIGYAADGVTVVDTGGSTNIATAHWMATAATQIVVADGWKTYTGFVKGRSAAGTTSARPSPIAPALMHNNVRYFRPTAYVNQASGTGTMQIDLVTVEAVEVGAVAGDNLHVGAITPEKIAMWAFNKNLVPDPSFEEPYAFLPTADPTSKHQWRHDWVLGNGYVERFQRPRSGKWAGRIGVTGSGSNSAALYCGNFPVVPGNTYNVQINAAKEHPNLSPNFYARVAGGSTDALTEYPGAPFTATIPWNGDVPDFVANLDLQWIGQNQYPNPDMLDENLDGIHDGAVAYSSGTITTGTRTVTVLAGDVYKQNLTAASIPNLARWGTQTIMTGLEMNRSYKVELNYTLSGTNARLRLYVDTYDELGGLVQQGLGSTVSAASGRIVLTVPANATVVEHRIYVWLESAAGTTATTAAGSWDSPIHYKIDASGMVDPDNPQYQTVSGSFTAPAGVTRASIHFMCNQPSGAQSLFLDDISVLESGQGGSELTSAGLRIFGNDGDEAVALVGNRKNYFSVQSKGATLASVDDEGKGAFATMSVRGKDINADGEIDEGFEIYGTEFLDWLNAMPRGVRSWENFGSDGAATTSAAEVGYGEVGFQMDPGRLYRVQFRAQYDHSTAGAGVQVRLRMTSADAPTAAPSPTVTSNTIIQTQGSRAATNGVDTTMSDFGYIYNETGIPKNVRILLTYAGTGTGAGARLIAAGTGGSTLAAPENGVVISVEDVGPYRAQGGAYNTGGAAVTPVQSYVKTFTSTTACTYMGSGAKDSSQGAEDMKQGYSSYDGDSRSLWIFPSMTSTLSGATVTKIRVYLYANHWYNNSGGTAKVKVHGHTSVPSTLSGSAPMTSAVTSTGWPKPGGRWVTLPSSLYAGFVAGTYRGIGVGPYGSTSTTGYGRFNKAGAKIEVTYKK